MNQLLTKSGSVEFNEEFNLQLIFWKLSRKLFIKKL